MFYVCSNYQYMSADCTTQKPSKVRWQRCRVTDFELVYTRLMIQWINFEKKLSVFVLYIDINIIWTCISYLPCAFMVFTIINNYVHYFHNKFDDMFEFLLLFYFLLRILPFKLISFERLMIIKYTRISFV